MKKRSGKNSSEDLRSEYDLSKLKGGVRGKYYVEAAAELENDPRFLARIESARRNLRAGRGVPLEEVEMANARRRRRS